MKWFHNLRVKFVALNLLVLLLCFGVFGLSAFFFTQHYIFTAVQKDFLEQTQVVADDIWPNLSRAQKYDYVKRWHRKYPGKKLYWYKQGEWYPGTIEVIPIMEMAARLLKNALAGKPSVENNFHGQMVALVPVGDGVLALTLKRLHDSPKYFHLLAILLLLSFVFISVLCLYPPTNKIIRLIRQLMTLAARVAQGRFGETITIKRSDEVGELAESFNHMSQQLAEVEKQNHNLIAGVSHELRSPLTRIRVNAEQLELSHNPADVESHSQAICKDVDHLDAIVSDLLNTAKMRIEPLAPHQESVEVCSLLKDIVQRYKSMERAKQIQIDYESYLTTLAINIDKHLFIQMVTNIIDNAVTSIGENGRILVHLQRHLDFCIIDIKDNGPGIEERHHKLIFERFYRIDPSRNRRTGGVGLGLTIVKQIIDAHHGRIELHSKPGEGSTFRIYLPVQ